MRVIVGRAPFRLDRNLYKRIRAGAWAEDAITAGKLVDMPLRWMDTTLEHLESVMRVTVTKKWGDYDDRHDHHTQG